MTDGKIAFCFPGQGSLESGMGRDIAEALPEAREVFEIGSEASGLDLEKLCFDTELEDMVETDLQQPALVATSLAIDAALRARGIAPDYVVGHSVGEFSALGEGCCGHLCSSLAPGWTVRRGGSLRHPHFVRIV